MKWNKFSEVQPEYNNEVLVYSKEGNVYTTGKYFKVGEVIERFMLGEGETPEMRLINMLKGKGPIIVADEEGVYVQQDLGTGNLEYVRAKEFTHWMYLPEPPEEGEE